MKSIDKFRCLAFLVALPLLVIGYIGWFSPFLGTALFHDEFPIGHWVGFTVDAQGKIYTGSGFYSRIQVYSPDGNFLRGWPIGDNGAFRMRLNVEEQLEVATVRGDRLLTFDSNGTLLSVKKNVGHDLYERWTKEDQSTYRDQQGNLYRPHFFLSIPQIVKISPLGQKTTLYSTPIRKWLFMGPLPAWLFFASAMGLMFFALGNLISSLKKG